MGPVFRQTGHKYGPIDLALIGIVPIHHANCYVQYTRRQKKLWKWLKPLARKQSLVCTGVPSNCQKRKPLSRHVVLLMPRPERATLLTISGYHPLVRRSLWMLLKSSVNSEQQAPKCPVLRLTRLVDQLQCFD